MADDESKKAEIISELAQSDSAALAALDAPATEEVVEETKVETPPEVKIEEGGEEEVKTEAPAPNPEDAINPRPHAKPDTHRDFAAIKQITADERAKRVAAETSLKEAQEKLTALEEEYKTKAITPEIEAKLKEHAEIRNSLFAEQEVTAKFADRIRASDIKVMNVLAASGMKPDLQEFIVSRGGVIVMSGSERQMPQNSAYIGKTEKQFIASLLPLLDEFQKERLQRAISSGMDLRDDMLAEIENTKANAPQIQAQKQKDLKEAFDKAAKESRAKLGKQAEKWEILATDTKEEKADKEKHNAKVVKYEKLYNDYLTGSTQSPATLADAFVQAAISQFRLEEIEEKNLALAEKDRQIAERDERINKIKGSGSTGKTTSAPTPTSAPDPGKLMSDAEALALAFPTKR